MQCDIDRLNQELCRRDITMQRRQGKFAATRHGQLGLHFVGRTASDSFNGGKDIQSKMLPVATC
jgi:hypothetical protein